MAILNPYRYSYSGADAKVFAMLSDQKDTLHLLESIHTISVSVHEAKGQSRALGHRGVKGFSRGVRTIAGSIILTVIEDHPLRQLMLEAEKVMPWYRGGWSLDQDMIGIGTALNNFHFGNRLVEMLPPVDLLITYVSEGGQFNARVSDSNAPTQATLASYDGAAMMIQGIDFVDSGMITSVNDIVSEITLSFIARDFKPIALNNFDLLDGKVPTGSHLESGNELRSKHSYLERILYGDWLPPTPDSATTNPDSVSPYISENDGVVNKFFRYVE